MKIVFLLLTIFSEITCAENEHTIDVDKAIMGQLLYLDNMIGDIAANQLLLETISGEQTTKFNDIAGCRINVILALIKINLETKTGLVSYSKVADDVMIRLKEFAKMQKQYAINVDLIDAIRKNPIR